MGAKSQAVADVSPALEALLTAFRDGGGGGPWAPLRNQAWSRFQALGFPKPDDEEWRQTPVAALAATPFAAADEEAFAEASHLPPSSGASRLVLVNGRFAPSLSSVPSAPDGWSFESLAHGLARDESARSLFATVTPWRDRPFAALNTALFRDGVLILIAPGAVLRDPLEVVHLAVPSAAEPMMIHPRVLVQAGAGAEATVVETFASSAAGTYWTNAVTEMVLGENARVDHVRIQDESPTAFHVASVDAHQSRNSRWASHNVSLGAALARSDLGSRLDGSGAEAHLYGLTVAGEKTHVDHHTVLDHAVAHCPSHELYKSILWDRARYVFNGRIVVRPDAQKTDAKQSNRNLLLSDDAVVFTRPQLEIYADDVRCTHGATIGRLDRDALFYLRARGLGREEARAVLIRAFAGEVLEHLRHPGLRERLEEEAVRRIPPARRG